MKELFRMDRKNYNPEGKVFKRPSARAVILKDGKVLLNYIEKFDCYEFPGGGIEAGETPEEAMIREYTEEQAAERAAVADKYGFTDTKYMLFHRVRILSAAEYRTLISTYSDHITIEESIRERFLTRSKTRSTGTGVTSQSMIPLICRWQGNHDRLGRTAC